MNTFRFLLAVAVGFVSTAFLAAAPIEPIPAPDWTLKDVNGKDVSFAELKGKVVVE